MIFNIRTEELMPKKILKTNLLGLCEVLNRSKTIELIRIITIEIINR